MKYRYSNTLLIMTLVCTIKCEDTAQTVQEFANDPIKAFKDREKLIKEYFGKASDFVVKEVRDEVQTRYASGAVGGRLTPSPEIPQQEKRFVEERQSAVHKALAKMYGSNAISDTLNLKVGIVLAGSELSGIVGTIGFLKELKSTRLLDIATHIASSSNASWPVISWLSGGTDFTTVDTNTVMQELIKVYNDLQSGKVDKLSTDFGKKIVDELHFFLKDVVLPKFIFDQRMGPVDVASIPLAMTLFNKKADRYQLSLASQLHKSLSSGNYEALEPFPFYMAIDDQKSEYIFSPLEITSWQGKTLYSFPLYAFNRVFKNGLVPDGVEYRSLEVNVPFLMAMFGSRMFVDMKALAKLMGTTIADKTVFPEPTSTLEKYGYLIARKTFGTQLDKKIAELQEKYGIKDEYTYVTQIKNPFFEYPQVSEELQKKATLDFMDASVSHGIAAEPLLRKERNLDLIIICNASDTSAQVASLDTFIKELESARGIIYERVTQGGRSEQVAEKDNLTLQLYRPQGSAQGPDIIYISMRKPSDALFNWAKRAAQQDLSLYDLTRKEDKMRAMSFKKLLGDEMAQLDKKLEYNATSFDDIMNRAQFNVRANFLEIIKDLIADIIKKKNGFSPEGKVYEETNSHSGLF